MDELEFDAKELFHFMNTHTDEFFIRVRFDEGGGLFGETDGCGCSEAGEGSDTFEYEADCIANGCGRAPW